jgi:hypothetical protein
MESKGRNLGGRAYLVEKLRERGLSRRQSVDILNAIFREMGTALRRGEYVEFPFGYLKAEKRVSKRWRAIGDEPMRPWFIEHSLGEEGERLLEGEKLPAAKPGWSRKVDRRSLVYLWDRALRREKKQAQGRPPLERRKVVNKLPRSGK